MKWDGGGWSPRNPKVTRRHVRELCASTFPSGFHPTACADACFYCRSDPRGSEAQGASRGYRREGKEEVNLLLEEERLWLTAQDLPFRLSTVILRVEWGASSPIPGFRGAQSLGGPRERRGAQRWLTSLKLPFALPKDWTLPRAWKYQAHPLPGSHHRPGS